MMDESVARFDWDDAFCFVFGHSICEPITPYRLCIYLLIRCLDAEHRQHAFTSKQLADLSSLIYSLMLAVNLSFTETCRVIEKTLERIAPNLYKNFLRKVDKHRGDMEILIRRDELLQPPRRSDRSERAHPLVTSKSLFGVFIRRLAVTRCLQSVSELQRSHEQWLDWLNDKRPSTSGDILAGYANDFSQKARFSLTTRSNPFVASNEVIHLTPLIEDVHLSAVKRRDKENQPSNEPQDVVMSTMCAISDGESIVNHSRNVFEYRRSPTAPSRRKVMVNGAEVQPQLEELQSSIRARAFIIRQLHQLQMSPEEAMPSEQLIAACAFIKSSYPHLSLVHLLEMLNGVRCRNAFAAEHALREFFDWATMHINEYQSSSSTITSIDMRPLRYAPLLHARLARLFDQREHARNLLIEAMQQAQANRDLICLRLAIVEQAAIDSLATPQPIIPKTSKKPNNTKQTSNGADVLTSVYKISPVMLMSMWASEGSIDDEAEATDGEERLDRHIDSADMRAFIRQLKDCSTLLGCIEQAIICENPESVRAGLQSCIMADYGVGRECSTRMINEAARIVSCTIKLQNGFSTDAASDANLLLYLNTGDAYCRRYDTETQVIAAVNIVYSHAINARYSSALSLLEIIKERFTMKNNWQCAIHWKRCECLVRFDRAFMLGEWNDAVRWLESMKSLAPDEANLRNAVLKFCEGYISDAMDLALYQAQNCSKSKDVRLRLRSDMMLAMIYASCGNICEARKILQRCLCDAHRFNLENFAAIVIRRIASIDALEGRKESALAKVSDCEWIIRTRCSRLENALLQITVFMAHAKCKSSHKNSSECEALMDSALALARSECRRACAPLLEKALLLEAAKAYNFLQNLEQRDECAAAFRDLDLKCQTTIKWTVL